MLTEPENNVEAQEDESLEIDVVAKRVLYESIYLDGDIINLSSDIIMYLPELQDNCPEVLNCTAGHLRFVSQHVTALLERLDRSKEQS